MRRERRAQPFATLEKIGERLELRPVKLLDPAILADDQRLFRLAKFGGERRFPGGDLAAQHVQVAFEVDIGEVSGSGGSVPARTDWSCGEPGPASGRAANLRGYRAASSDQSH